ncbi:MAG: type II secretion system F family protein [Bdellovibrionota bacterium]
MTELLLIAGLFMVGVAVYLFSSMLLSSNNDAQSLLWASDDEPAKSRSKFIELSRPLVHKFCLGLAAKIKNPGYRKRVQEKIGTAGLQREINVDEFIGLQILWGLLFPVMLVFLNFTMELGYSPVFLICFGLFGAYFPHMHASTERKKRYQSVIVDLPFFIDLMALSTEAGLDFIGSIQRVVEKAENSVLADELGQVLRDLKLGSTRAESLKKMAERLDISEVTSFVTVLIDADSTGASIGTVLKQQSIQMRLERFTRAEKEGAKASQTILIPLMLFILPAVFIMVFGPVIIQFLGQGGS